LRQAIKEGHFVPLEEIVRWSQRDYYSENDKYFGKDKPRGWFRAFQAAGGKGEFVQLPPHGADGHGSFTNNPAAWRPAFEAFLRQNGF